VSAAIAAAAAIDPNAPRTPPEMETISSFLGTRSAVTSASGSGAGSRPVRLVLLLHVLETFVGLHLVSLQLYLSL
jgi:hypothetical protein